MSVISIQPFLKIFNFSRLSGPLFDKELRVSSRRNRNYVLRFVYVILLTIFVAFAWIGTVKYQGSAVFQKSRMAVAGKTIITTIVMFQFFATQLIAIIMLSTSISDEIYNKTLGALMTTPITSFQIVVGKLLSKLLQIVQLLAISLPLLAIIRVFGGVPWSYLLSSLCITLTAVIFAGAFSLYFSIRNKRAFVVIIKTVVALGILFFFLPIFITAIFTPLWQRTATSGLNANLVPVLAALFVHLNPFAAVSINATKSLSATQTAGINFFFWPLHCALMLGASAFLIWRSVRIVRKAALRQATGQLEPFSKLRSKLGMSLPEQSQTSLVKPVNGSPVIWKELRAPMIQGRDGRNSIIGFFIALTALLITYGIGAYQRNLDEGFTHVSYGVMFIVIGSIFNMVLSATAVTIEKESRTWPILLTTSMDEWYILLGKAAGVIRRCSVIWLFLAGHIIVFIIVRYIHPFAFVHMFILVSGLVVFLTGTGIYFSSRFRRTTTAVVANFAFALVVWIVVPAFLGAVLGFVDRNDTLEATLEAYISANPVAQTGIIMDGSAGVYNARLDLSRLKYEWPARRRQEGVWSTTRTLLITAAVYACCGFLFAWRARYRFRKNIF